LKEMKNVRYLYGHLAICCLFMSCFSVVYSFSSGDLRSVLDKRYIQHRSNLKTFINQPQKTDAPVLKGNSTWDRNPYVFGSVVYDQTDSCFKMWYQTYYHGYATADRCMVHYATSSDGINWVRPNLGLIDFQGSTDNNIVLKSLGFGDLYNPSVVEVKGSVDPNRRYRMIFCDFKASEDGSAPETYRDAGLWVAFSPDGINWTRYGDEPLKYLRKEANSISDVMDVMQDPVSGKFIAFTKGWCVSGGVWPGRRQVVRIDSSDFINWSSPSVAVPNIYENKLGPQSYGMPVFYHAGMYWGLLRSYKSPGDETIDIRLVMSTDTYNWEPVGEGNSFIPVSGSGWDSGMIFTAPPFVYNDQIHIYYGGWDGPHNTSQRSACIGLARLSVGRLGGVTPFDGRGVLITEPFLFDGSDIFVNADAKDSKIRVAILDEAGFVIKGYDFNNFTVLDMDSLEHRLQWDNKDMGSLKNQRRSIRLKFELEHGAKLYGYGVI
jgi:hypothetical protein